MVDYFDVGLTGFECQNQIYSVAKDLILIHKSLIIVALFLAVVVLALFLHWRTKCKQ